MSTTTIEKRICRSEPVLNCWSLSRSLNIESGAAHWLGEVPMFLHGMLWILDCIINKFIQSKTFNFGYQPTYLGT